FCSALGVSAAHAQGSAPPSTTPARKAYRIFTEVLGKDAVDSLHDYGYLLRFGDSARDGRIPFVAWEALENLITRRAAWTSFVRAYDTNIESPNLIGKLGDLRDLQALPSGGFMSSGVRTAVDLLAAHFHDAKAIPDKAVRLQLPRLFETPVGTALLARAQVALRRDSEALAREYFRELLSGPEAPAEARNHFLHYMNAVHGSDLKKTLNRDRADSKLSDDLSKPLARYLRDQRRLWNVHSTPKRLQAISRRSNLKADLKALKRVLAAMTGASNLIAKAKGAWTPTNEKPKPHLEVTDFHVYSLQDSDTIDTGDTVEISLAYWVKGLVPKRKARVTIAGFIDGGKRGILQRTTKTKNRKNGGPYTHTVRVKMHAFQPVIYRFHLGEPQSNTIHRSVDLSISPRLAEMHALAAEAENLRSICRLDEAAEALRGLQTELKPLTGKFQFKEMLADVGRRSAQIAQEREKLAQLRGGLDGARLHSIPGQCEYRTERVERSLKLLGKLPPGCGVLKENGETPLRIELAELFRRTDTRRANQEGFRRATAEARKFEENCRFRQATRRYATALAILESDPGALCGVWRREHGLLGRRDLHRTRSASSLAKGADRNIHAAKLKIAKGESAAALKILNPLITAISALENANCYKHHLKRARELASSVEASLETSAIDLIEAAMPKEDPEEIVEAVRKSDERLRRRRRAEIEREWSLESPNSPDAPQERPVE
ncbi:MAG: hypothetical protein V3S11_03640, partial [Elusimicrobiota bacterium]